MDFLSRVRADRGRSLLGWTARGLVDIVYPKTCAGCGARGTWLCTYCDVSGSEIAGSICDRCGVVRKPGSGCWCGRQGRYIDRARSAYEFDGWARSMVHRTKYGEEPARAAWMAERMVPLLTAFGSVDGLVPVPLYRARLDQRGYNQSELIARGIESATGIAVVPLLVRIKPTMPQVSLAAKERAKNVEGAFALDPSRVAERGRHYILIDDVRTSGATINACARVLCESPGVRVSVLTFAVAS